MKRFLIAAVLLVLVLLLLLALNLFVMGSVLDKDGMENPFPENTGSLNGPEDATIILRAGRPGKGNLPVLHR